MLHRKIYVKQTKKGIHWEKGENHEPYRKNKIEEINPT
jgi:hypothetical protein